MKGLKVVAIILGSLLLVVILVAALALTPSVQTWAVRKALAGQPGVSGEIGRVAAGFSSADIQDVRIEKAGAVITLKGLTAAYSAWDYLTASRLNVDRVQVQEILIDLRNAQPAPEEPKPKPSEPFNGILSQAQLPFDVRVAELTANGRVLLPANQTATFTLNGRNIETGQRGTLQWDAQFEDATPAAPLAAIRSNGTLAVHVSADRRIDVAEIDAVATVEGRNLPRDRFQLIAKAEQPAPGGNEGYNVQVGLQRDGRLERLLTANAQYLTGDRRFAGAWELAVKSEQLAALLSGLGLPEIAANGAGKFTLQPDTTAVSGNGDLHATISRLEKISPELSAIGTVQVRTTFDGGFAENAARLERLHLDVTSNDGRKLAQINSTQPIAFDVETKRVTFADPKAALARVTLSALPLAWAQPFVKDLAIDSGDLSLALAIEAEPDGSRIRARSAEPLSLRAVTIRSGQKPLVEKLSVTARPSIDYSATRISAELTDINVNTPGGDAIGGRVQADITNVDTTPKFGFAADLRGKLVAALKPYLPLDPGPLAFATTVEGRMEGQTFHLAKSTTNVDRDGGALLASIELQQPITANLEKTTFSVPKPDATAARIRLGEIPLAWAEAFVTNAKLGGSLAGAGFDVSFRSADDATLTATEPLTLRGVTAALDGKPVLQGVDLLADLTATKRGDVIRYELRRFELRQGNLALASAAASGEVRLGEKFAIAAKGKLEADIPALMNQPVAAPYASLSRGKLTTDFDVNLADAMDAKAVVVARGLVAREKNQPLGDLQLDVTASLKPDGTGTFNVPLTLAQPSRRSDLVLQGSFGKARDDQSLVLAANIASNQLFVDDFQLLAGAAPATDKPAATSSTRPTTQPTTPRQPGASAGPGAGGTMPAAKDTVPFWQGVQGKVQLDLKRVVYGKDYVISPVRGTATITPNRIALDGLEGRFNENPFKSAAAVTFNAAQPKPYALTGSADVSNFDVGAFLRAATPNEKPAMEGRVNVGARLNGTGANVGDLAKNVYGRFDLTGSNGVLRALGRKAEVASAASTILGIAGALTKSNTTSAFAELTAAFAELSFDSFKMQVERGADLSFKLTNIEFISPIMRTTGMGQIVNREGVELENQPMQIQLQFGAKDSLAQLLNRAGVLTGQQDDRGYYLLERAFTVGGTPAQPDSGSLWKILLREAALQGIPALLNRR